MTWPVATLIMFSCDFPASMTLVFARWNQTLTHESIPSKLVKKMIIAFAHHRHWLVLNMASLSQEKSEASGKIIGNKSTGLTEFTTADVSCGKSICLGERKVRKTPRR